MSVAAIVLAAGASTRLGQPKQNIRLGAARDIGEDNETLLERSIRVAGLAALSPVFVVVAPGHDYNLDSAAIVLINRDAAEGMASSIRVGVASAIARDDPAFAGNDIHGVVILACDQPAVTAEHLRALAAGGSETVASSYAGRNGVPAYFPRSVFPNLLHLRGDTGARELLRYARSIPLEHGELDIDTVDDLKRARQLLHDQHVF